MANDVYNAGRALAQGLAMGWSDEAEAKARSMASGRPYEDELADIKREYAQFAEEYPIMQPALEFAGGAIPAVASMLIPGGQIGAPAAVARIVSPLARIARAPGIRNLVSGIRRTGDVLSDVTGYGKTVGQRSWGQNVGRAAVSGTAQGGIEGAGASEGSRTLGALMGAGFGGITGGAMTVIPGALGAAGRYAQQYFAPIVDDIKQAAARRLSSVIDMDPTEMQTRLELDRAMGVPSLPLNVSPEATGLAETMATRPGPSQSTIGAGIAQQREGVRDRLASQISQNLAPTSYYATRENMTNSLRARAQSLYNKAYEHGSVDDPKILEYLDDPLFRQAYAQGRELSEMEARQAARMGEDVTPFQIEQVYRSTGVVDPERVAVLKAMGIADADIQKYLTDQNAMTMERVALPNVQTLDYIKRGLDTIIRTGMNSSDDLVRQKARLLKDARNSFVERLDQVVPDYRAARREYAGDMEVLDAMDSGFNDFSSVKPEELASMWKSMSAAEKEGYRIGVARNLWGRLMDPSTDANFAKRLINSPSERLKYETIFASPAQYDLFKKALDRESQLFSDATRVVGNSASARRQAGLAAFEEDPLLTASMTMATQGFEGGLTAMVMNALSKGRVSDSVAKQLGEWLTADDPTKVSAAVEALQRFAQDQAVTQPRRFGQSAAITGGTIGAAPPVPEQEEE
jgi:hypothetical protein